MLDYFEKYFSMLTWRINLRDFGPYETIKRVNQEIRANNLKEIEFR